MNRNRKLWYELIQTQLSDLDSTELPQHAIQIHVTISIHQVDEFDADDTEIVNKCVALVQSPLPRAVISLTLRNLWEYPGIRTVWDLAQQIPSDELNHSAILYFHSKGMSYDTSEVRNPIEIELFETIIRPWKSIISILHNQTSINKVCWLKSHCGWCWVNFWIARASYVEKLVCPIVRGSAESERYYYESWLSLVNENAISWPKVNKIDFGDGLHEHGVCSGHDDCWPLTSQPDECLNPGVGLVQCGECTGSPRNESNGC